MNDFDPAAIAASYDVVAEDYATKLFNELDQKPFDRALLDDVAGWTRGRGVVCDLGCGPGHRLNPALRFEQGNMLDLDVADGAWAGVLAMYSLIHIERSQVPVALAEVHRVLAPGGLLVVAVHAGSGEIRSDEFLGHDVPFTGTYFERGELVGAVEAAGFAVERVDERGPYESEAQPQRVYVVARA